MNRQPNDFIEEAARLHFAGWGYGRIAKHLGRSKWSVRYWLNREAMNDANARWAAANRGRRNESQRRYMAKRVEK